MLDWVLFDVWFVGCRWSKRGERWGVGKEWFYFVWGYVDRDCILWWEWWRQERPYHDDSTASRLLSEVKHRRARLVLRWGTTLESRVLFFCRSPLFYRILLLLLPPPCLPSLAPITLLSFDPFSHNWQNHPCLLCTTYYSKIRSSHHLTTHSNLLQHCPSHNSHQYSRPSTSQHCTVPLNLERTRLLIPSLLLFLLYFYSFLLLSTPFYPFLPHSCHAPCSFILLHGISVQEQV